VRVRAAHLALALLAGCGWTASEGEEAERRYVMAGSNDPSPEERCRRGREVVEAYLRDGNEHKYKHWRAINDVECSPQELRWQAEQRQREQEEDRFDQAVTIAPSPPANERPAARSPASGTGGPMDDVMMDAEPAAPARPPALARAAMCYKDYCPCDAPQGGPDTVLCDQLEEGIEVPIDLMIAGRGMREARRQIEEFERR
jgi:hypothetical protein